MRRDKPFAIGDFVRVTGYGYAAAADRFGTVTSMTKTQGTVEMPNTGSHIPTDRFMLDSGLVIGTGDSFHRRYVYQSDNEEYNTYQRKARFKQAAESLNSTNFHRYSSSTVMKVLKTLQADPLHKPKKESE